MKRSSILAIILTTAILLGLALTVSAGLSLAQSDPPAADSSASAATVEYTLVTGGGTGQLVYVGRGGEIDGVVNPTLTARPGDVVKITLVNEDAMLHDLVIDEFNAATKQFADRGEEDSITFTVNQTGTFIYYCSVPGHKAAGMLGKLVVGTTPAAQAEGADIVRNPSDVPAPLAARDPETVEVDLVAEEVLGQLADGTVMSYFTFNGTVPGPMIRVRVGDTVVVNFRNASSSQFPHSLDFHAATGPGGGAVFSNLGPGEETTFSFKALNPGLFVYHCATPSVAHHIAMGMYGLILVEPEKGLPAVDREFYVMQGEIYTEEPYGSAGYVNFSHDKMLDEQPEYFVFNGAANALTSDEHAMQANLGETVRIYFGVGGPNFVSSFHVIGEIFDRVYDQASLTSPPLTDVQTTLVPAGGAAMVEFTTEVPGRYILVDHALSRAERGLMGYLNVMGEEQPDIFDGTLTHGSGH